MRFCIEGLEFEGDVTELAELSNSCKSVRQLLGGPKEWRFAVSSDGRVIESLVTWEEENEGSDQS